MDDSGATASSPFPRRARCHSDRRPAACIPSKWDGTGRRKATRARQTAGRLATTRSQLSALLYQTIHFASKFLRRRLECRTARVDHYIPLWPEFRQPDTQGFAEPSFHPVPADRFSQRPRSREAQSWPPAFRARNPQAKRRKVRTRNSNPLFVDFAEIGRSQNSGSSGKSEASRRIGRLSRHSRSAYGVPWHAGERAPPGRPCFSFVLETHVFWRACDCSAEMYVLA